MRVPFGAILDGEIVCLDWGRASELYKLLFGRSMPLFCAFDVLQIDGENMRGVPLLERKQKLFAIMPRIETHLPYVDFIHERGTEFSRCV